MVKSFGEGGKLEIGKTAKKLHIEPKFIGYSSLKKQSE
jgi:hypothetical protein